MMKLLAQLIYLFSGMSAKLDRIEKLLKKEEKHMTAQDDALAALTAQVATNTTVEESAVALIKGFAAQLAAAGTDPAKLSALQASLATSETDLAAAVSANTPAAPAAPAAPTA